MTRAGRKSAPSQRQLRAGELVRQVLADLFMRGEVRDPALEKIILTVSEVRMSPDLRVATVFVSALGQTDGEALARRLDQHARFLRGRVAASLRQMRVTPELRFRFDSRYDDDARVGSLLHPAPIEREEPDGEA